MSSRFARQLFRLAARRTSAGTSRAGGQRWASTHAADEVKAKSSDLPWLIGAGVITFPTTYYILTQHPGTHHAAAHQGSHGHDAKEIPHTPTPTKDDEGTEVPAAEVKESITEAYQADSPKDAEEAEEGKSTQQGETSEFDGGAPGQDEKSEGDVEQTSKPSTVAGGREPLNQGDARSKSTDGQDPKQVQTELDPAKEGTENPNETPRKQ